MDKYSNRIVANLDSYRREESNGRSYLVVPAVPVREQVMNNYLVPGEELTYATIWNGCPITIRHPQLNNGSAQVPNPDVAIIGRFFNADWDEQTKRVTGEYWIDIDDALRYAEGQYIVNAIYSNKILETSTGYWADAEMVPVNEFNGRKYDTVHRNLKPDHIAILVDAIGACSVADGCGVNRNELSLFTQLYTNECLYQQGGPGSGGFGHLGRPGQVGGSRTSAPHKNPKVFGKTLKRDVNAYYVTEKGKKSKYSDGIKSRTSLMSKAKAQILYDRLSRGGFDPVIFEIKLKKGQKFNSLTGSSISVDSVAGTAIKEIDLDTLKSRRERTFQNEVSDCGCTEFDILVNEDSLAKRIEEVYGQFTTKFMKPVEQEYLYVKDIFDGYCIVSSGDDLYRVDYTESNGEVTFAERDSWKPVEMEYVEQGEDSDSSMDSTVDSSAEVETNVVTTLPKSAARIYESVYAEALKKFKGDKAKASKIAWGAVKQAGYKKDAKSGKWMKGDVKSNTVTSSKSIVIQKSKELPMAKKKLSLNSILELIRGKGYSVQLNNGEKAEDGEEEEIELELEEDENDGEVEQNTAVPAFTNEEITGLKALLKIDWSKVTGVMDKLPTVLEMAQNAEAEKTTRKAELVSLILNSGTAYNKEELESLSLPILTKMYGSHNVNYAGLGGGQVYTNVDEADVLGVPSVTFEKE